jgi:hypothetical protein
MAPWTLEHRVFVFEAYIATKSVIAVLRTQFNVQRHGNIPDRNTILRWVKAFKATGCHEKEAAWSSRNCAYT